MSAARSALAGLCRRSCVSSGSSAAASMPASLRPAAGRNLESRRCFSSKGWGPAAWLQRYKDSVIQGDIEQRARSIAVHIAMLSGTSSCYLFTSYVAISKLRA
ncbi:hypothetical protein ACP70R_030637 [Stipagrostis hirtigluma subsp. patula]